MTKLRLGPANERILKSNGPCIDNPNSMYHTSYASSHPSGVLEKRVVHSVNKIQQINRPTGYNANFRPCIYYTPKMDDLDNPSLKMNVKTHYQTGNDIDFKPYLIGPSGEHMNFVQHDILPSKSGFTTMNDRAYIEPTSSTKNRVFNQKRTCSKLFYDQVIKLDPLSKENDGTGPKDMSTENSSRFKGEQGRWDSQSWRFHKSIGEKEPTANTRVHPFDPIEYLPRNPYRHDTFNSQYYVNKRKTGVSEQETHFKKHQFHADLPRQGAAGICEPAARSNRNTGYSHETTKPRYCDSTKTTEFNDDTYLSATRSDANRCTLARYSFTAPGITSTTMTDGIGSRHVGNKEATGYVKNHPSYLRSQETNAARFTTHYMTRFTEKASRNNTTAACNKATLALSSAGWPVCKAANGFTKSTRVHHH